MEHSFIRSVGGEAFRNWGVDALVEWGLNQYKIDPKTDELRPEYLQLMYVLQHSPEPSRAAIIVFAQGLHEVWHLIPYDKLPFGRFPWLKSAMEITHEQFKEACEQLPDTMRAYAAEAKIEYPADFKPVSVEQAVQSFFSWLTDSVRSLPENFISFVTGRADLFQKSRSGAGQQSSGQFGHLTALEDDPELHSQWVDILTGFAGEHAEMEDTIRRVDQQLTPAIVRKIVAMDPEKRIAFLKFLAKDTFGEKLGKMADHVVEPIEKVLDASAAARKALQDKRAARRAARPTPAPARIVPMPPRR